MESQPTVSELITVLYEMGKTRKDIAKLLKVNERTVTHLCRYPTARLDYRAYAKLKDFVKRTREELVAKTSKIVEVDND